MYSAFIVLNAFFLGNTVFANDSTKKIDAVKEKLLLGQKQIL
jgi:hypothetical protein